MAGPGECSSTSSFSPLGAPWLRASSRTRVDLRRPTNPDIRRQSRSLSHPAFSARCAKKHRRAYWPRSAATAAPMRRSLAASAPSGRRPKSRCSLRPSTQTGEFTAQTVQCFADRPRNDPGIVFALVDWSSRRCHSQPQVTPSLLTNDCLPAPGVGRVPSKFLRSGSF